MALPNRNLGVDEVDQLQAPRALASSGCLLQPGPRGESLVALDRTGGGGFVLVIIIPSSPHEDFLGLLVSSDLNIPLSFATHEDLLLHNRPYSLLGLVDLLLASTGDLCSQVLIEILRVLPMRISIFLKKNEAQEAGFLC